MAVFSPQGLMGGDGQESPSMLKKKASIQTNNSVVPSHLYTT